MTEFKCTRMSELTAYVHKDGSIEVLSSSPECQLCNGFKACVTAMKAAVRLERIKKDMERIFEFCAG